MFKRVIFFVLGLCCLFSHAEATEHLDIYQVNVPVVSKAHQAWSAAASKALKLVLIRASGSPSVLNNVGVQEQITHPASFVESFRYQHADQSMVLQFVFNPHAVKALLTEVKCPIWKSDRPRVLLWVEELGDADSDASNHVLTESSPLADVAKAVSELRGLPVVLPSMDLEDQSNGHRLTLSYANARYGADVLFKGQLSQEPSGDTVGEWTLYMSSSPIFWESRAKTRSECLRLGMNSLIDHLAGRLAVSNQEADQVQVSVSISGVNSLLQYHAVQQKISRLSPVTHVELENMNADNVVLHLTVSGGGAALQSAMATLPNFQSQPLDANEIGIDLHYHYGRPAHGHVGHG